MRTRRTLVGAFLICSGCRATVPRTYEAPAPAPMLGCRAAECSDSDRVVTVTYLGVSGLMIEHQGHVLLTAPFFSNPRLGLVRPKVTRLFRGSPRISADSEAVERWLPKGADRASVILVGHGHYDHLLDIPYIATHRARSAVVYGSMTVRHMLMGERGLREQSGKRLVAIHAEDEATRDSAGKWFYAPDSAFRFMALRGDHAPTFRFLWESYTFAAGNVPADLDSLPRTAADWKLGEPLAYLIDVLAPTSHDIAFRIFFQDAPSAPPLGFPPTRELQARGIDLAVLCAATSSNVPYTPDSLLMALRPANVMVTHWESFFRSQDLPPEVSRGLDLEKFLGSLRRSLDPRVPWIVARPHQVIRFPTHMEDLSTSLNHANE